MQEEVLNDDMDDNFNDDFNFNGLDSFGEGGQSPMDKHEGLLKDLTNFDPIIKTRILNWLGLVWDESKEKYMEKKVPIMNEQGAYWAIDFLQTYQAKVNFMTNLSKDELSGMQLDIIQGAWLVFGAKFDQFEIRDTADQWKISNALVHSAFLVLAGAGDGKYTKFLGESVTRNESINLSDSPNRPSPQQQRGGFMSAIKNMLPGGR